MTPQAERRLKVLQSLDTLGAGFQLASHDLDIRGAGNLLGDEQSGHIKEVGFELYQQMLEEAVMSLKSDIAEPISERWSPQITIGTPVLIPEDYVGDLNVRLTIGTSILRTAADPYNTNGSNTGATKQAGEPNHANVPGGKSVWYRWTPTASGTAGAPTSSPSRMRHTPKGRPCLRQSLAMSM